MQTLVEQERQSMDWHELKAGGRTVAKLVRAKSYPAKGLAVFLPGDAPHSSSGSTAHAFARIYAEMGHHLLIVEYPRLIERKWNVVSLAEAIQATVQALELVKQECTERVSSVVGSSFGGTLFLATGDLWRDVDAVVLKSPAPLLSLGYLNEHGAASLTDWTDSSANGALAEVLRSASLSYFTVPVDQRAQVLTVHGTEDQIIPYKHAQLLTSLNRNFHLKSIEGCDHFFARPGDRDKLYKYSRDFLLANLTQKIEKRRD